MVKVTEIKENEKELYKEYTDLLRKIIEKVSRLFLIQIDEDKFLMGCEEDVYALVNYDDKQYYSAVLDEQDKICYYTNDDFCYFIYLNSYIPLIQKSNLNTNEIEQLFLTVEDSISKSFLQYYKESKQNNTSLKIEYDITGHRKTLNSYLKLLHAKKPNKIILRQLKSILGIIKYQKKIEYFRGEEESYAKPIVFKNNAMCIGNFVYDFEHVKKIIEEYGYDICVPDEMIDLFTDNSEKVKTLQKVIDEYKNNIKN